MGSGSKLSGVGMENVQSISSLRRRSSMLHSAKLVLAMQPKGQGVPKVRTGSLSNADSLDVEQTRSMPMRHSRTESITRAKLESILGGRLKSTEDPTAEALPAPHSHSPSPVPMEPTLQEAPFLEQASEEYVRIEHRSGSGLDVSERSREDEEAEEESVDSLAMAPSQPGSLRKQSILAFFCLDLRTLTFLGFYMSDNKEANSLTFWRSSEVNQDYLCY